MTFDIAVIGAGIVGSAIARDLAGTGRSVVLIEARADVGDGTSKANTAILHTGFDAIPGTLEARLVARGYHLLGEYAARTGIPIERTGALLVAWDDEELGKLPELQAKAEANGYDECRLVDAAQVYERVPDLGLGALGGLTVPDESIICTWTTNLALATDAVRRGAVLRRGARVVGVRRGEGSTRLVTTSGDVTARWVINAAGLGADHLDRSFGHDRFTVTPRRGELFVFDKLARSKVPCIVLPVPSSRGKGVLVSPTIYGNVMLGPTSENLTDRTATGTSQKGFDFLIGKGRRLMPSLLDEEVTAAYAGLRAAIGRDDYLIDVDAERRIRARGRYPFHRPHRGDGHRRARRRAAAAQRHRPQPAQRSARSAEDADDRRSRPSPLPGRGADPGRLGVRSAGVLLREGQLGRDPRCLRLAHPAR